MLLDLFAGTLDITKIKIDKRRLPKVPTKEDDDFWREVANFVLTKLYEGNGKAEAVSEAAEKFEIEHETRIYEKLNIWLGDWIKAPLTTR